VCVLHHTVILSEVRRQPNVVEGPRVPQRHQERDDIPNPTLTDLPVPQVRAAFWR